MANCFAKETTRNYSENVNVKSIIRTLRQVQCSNGIILEHFRKIHSVCPIETERQRSNAEEKRKHTERTHKRASKTQGKGMKGPAHSAFRNLSPFLALPLSLSLALFNVSFYACFLSKAAAKFQCIQLAQWDKQRFACNETNITSESHE